VVDEEACRGLQWVENGRRSSLRGDLWSCSAIDEEKVLLDAMNSWEKPIGPDWFTIPYLPRTSGFFGSQAESSLLTHMHCRNTSGMPVQSLAGPPYLAAAPVRHSRLHKV
jgi:hypothetical protein